MPFVSLFVEVSDESVLSVLVSVVESVVESSVAGGSVVGGGVLVSISAGISSSSGAQAIITNTDNEQNRLIKAGFRTLETPK